MNKEIRALEPKALWNNFADLNAVPRASKKEEQVIEFMKSFGNRLNLSTEVDHVGNVIIRKPATKGMENRQGVVLQSHLDMVHQKNNDSDFDFETQGIEMFIEGDWVKAKGTTLGADNGLGVATMMAVLESDSIAHPALEALFTIDEETGMTGAMGLQPGVLQGDILLNLDTEEDDEISIGCAGGVDLTATRTYKAEPAPSNATAYRLSVKGLQGGHSGMEIHKGLGNANKIMNRLLYTASSVGARISEIDGGGLRNAIPRESEAVVVVTSEDKAAFEATVKDIVSSIKTEFSSVEPNLNISYHEASVPSEVMEAQAQDALLKAIYAAHNGVYRMSPDMEGLVEASNNVARVLVKNGDISVLCLTRSSVDSSKEDLALSLRAGFELGGFQVELSGTYPGWAPNMESPILKVLDEIYQDMNQERARIGAGHAGLECGILGRHYPDMDMISFGPTIRGAHSPDERASISSAKKYWRFVLRVLESIPMSDNA